MRILKRYHITMFMFGPHSAPLSVQIDDIQGIPEYHTLFARWCVSFRYSIDEDIIRFFACSSQLSIAVYLNTVLNLLPYTVFLMHRLPESRILRQLPYREQRC